MERFDYENTKESKDGAKLPAGGYIVEIKKVTDVKEKKYLEIELEIASGDFKGEIEELFMQFGFWRLKHYASYKETAQGLFKHFTESVVRSNDGYAWDFNENTLVGKLLGVTIGYEEYEGNNGAIKTRTKIVDILDVEDIKSNNFKVPQLKEMKREPVETTTEQDLDLPF